MAETIQTKRCPQCKQFKPISEFNKHRSNKDGLQSYCKICHRKNTKEFSQTEKGRVCQKRGQKRFRKQNPKYHKEHQKEYQKTEKGKVTRKRFYTRHPNHLKAKNIVKNAIRDGKLPQPNSLQCSCGESAQHYHHHLGYAPEHLLDVIPVCQECHRKLHQGLSLDKVADTKVVPIGQVS